MFKQKISRYLAPVATALLMLAILPATVDADEQEEPILRQYHVQFVSVDVAAHLASEICQSNTQEVCRYGIVSDKLLELIASDEQHSEFAQLLSVRDVPPASQSFQVMILSAHREEGTSDELPGFAQNALDDVSEFLPFRGYRLVDTGWIRTARRGNITLGEGGSFAVELHFRGGDGGNEHLLIEGFNLHHRRTHRTEDGQLRYISDFEEILSSSFGIDLGETVVVGTSKLNGGDEAMVVLLTAVR